MKIQISYFLSHDALWNDGWRNDGRRVSAHDRDDLIAINLKTVVEADHNVVGEHTRRFLKSKKYHVIRIKCNR